MDRRTLMTAAGTALISVLLLGACADAKTTVAAPAPAAGPAGVGITATGTGRVSGTPDVATITVGVEVRADTAQAALDEASTGAGAVIDALQGAGVAQADVATSNVSLSPVYAESGERVVGYQASNTVTATLRDLEGAGEVIDAAATAGGGDAVLYGISFSFSDTSELVAEARQQAVERAQEQAAQLAEAAGVTLGPLVSVTESSSSLPAPLPFGGDVAEAAAVPIEPGSQELSVAVTAVYAIAGRS